MQFIPRDEGGGFVAAYEFEEGVCDDTHLPEGAEFDPENRNRAYFPDSGNECVHYQFIAGFLWDAYGQGLEYVIPFKGTGHTVQKTWNTKRLRQRLENGAPMPAHGVLYPVTTATKRNKKGQWFQFEVGNAVPLIKTVKDEIVVNEEAVQLVGGDPMRAFIMGRSLAGAISSGQKIVGVEDDVVDEVDGHGSNMEYDDSQQMPDDANL